MATGPLTRATRVDAGLTKDEVAARREELTPKVVKLRQAGRTWVEIAEEVGVPRSTVQKWVAPIIQPHRREPKPKPVAGSIVRRCRRRWRAR